MEFAFEYPTLMMVLCMLISWFVLLSVERNKVDHCASTMCIGVH